MTPRKLHNPRPPRAPQRPFTPEQDERILELRGKGISFKRIAQMLNRNVDGVVGRYYHLTNDPGPADRHWPPKKDPWPIKLDFSEHEVKLKPGSAPKKFQRQTEHRSLYGCAARMCVG